MEVVFNSTFLVSMMNTHNLKFKSQLGAADDEALLMTRQIINEANTLDERVQLDRFGYRWPKCVKNQ